MHRHSLLALILAGAVVTVTGSALAQDNGSAPPPQAAPAGPPPGGHGQGPQHMDPQRRVEMLTKHLNLTSDQQAKVLDILKSSQSQMMSLHSDTSTAPEDKRAKMMEIRKSSDDQIRAVLDPAQVKKFDEMQARRNQWQGQGQHQGGQMSPPPPDSQN